MFSTGQDQPIPIRCVHMGLEPTDLELSILRTAVWFSQLEQPITAFEIWKWLLTPARTYGLGEVYAALERSEWLIAKIEHRDGLYVLRGSVGVAELARARREKFLDAERKFCSLKRVASFFHLVPGVCAVGAVNTLAWWSTNTKSDIDLFVVTKPGSVWASRFWLVLPFALLGRRPCSPPCQGGEGGGLNRDPFCFSFFVTNDATQLESVCLSRDYYMSFWVKSIVPILDRGEWFAKIDQLNRWSSRHLPNARGREFHHRHRASWVPALPIQFKILEPILRKLQRDRFPSTLRELANRDTRVIITDQMLKFHDNDHRAEFRDRFEKRFSECL